MSSGRRAAASIAVAGAGGSSPTARSFLRAELDGVRFVDAARPDAAWSEETLRETDMLVLVADGAGRIDAGGASALAKVARERGALVAAIIVSPDGLAGRSPVLAALRDAADMVMVVRDSDDVRAVVAALR